MPCIKLNLSRSRISSLPMPRKFGFSWSIKACFSRTLKLLSTGLYRTAFSQSIKMTFSESINETFSWPTKQSACWFIRHFLFRHGVNKKETSVPRKTCLWIVWINKELGRFFRHVVNKKIDQHAPLDGPESLPSARL